MVHFFPSKKNGCITLLLIFFICSLFQSKLFAQANCHNPPDGVFFDNKGGLSLPHIDTLKKNGLCYDLPAGTGSKTVCYTYTYPSSGTIIMKYAIRFNCSGVANCTAGMSGNYNSCSNANSCGGGGTTIKTYDINCNVVNSSGVSIGTSCSSGNYVPGKQYTVCFQVPLNPSCPITICPIMECSSNQCACPATLTANAGADQSFCETSSTSLTGNVVPQGSGKWTQVSGPNTATITTPNTSNTTVTGLVGGAYTFRYTITCGNKSKSDDVIVTVKPKPVASASFSTPVCSGSPLSIALSSTVGSTTYAWSANGSANIFGLTPTSGNGTPINHTLSVTNTSTGTVTYTVTPTANGCAGSAITVPVTVNPLPTFTITNNKPTICSGDNTDITYTTAGVTFAYTVQSVTGSVTGASAGSGTSITQTLTNSGTTAGTVVYEIEPTSVAGCKGAKKTVLVTVNPRPAVTTDLTPQTICSGTSVAIDLKSNITATFSWSSIQNGVTGSAGSGSGTNSITEVLNTTGTAPGSVVYTIIATAGGCTNAGSAQLTVNVNPKPTISIPAVAAICVGQSVNLTTTGVVPVGGTYSWTPGGSTADTITVSPTTTSNYTVKYTVNNCSTQASTVVTVNSLPTVSINADATDICSDKTTKLTANGLPGPGVLTWQHNGYVGTTVTVSPGSYTVTYKLTSTGCSQTDTKVITSRQAPTVNFNVSSSIICAGDSTSLTATPTPAVPVGTFLWMPGSGNKSSIKVAPTTTTTYTLTYTSTNGCAVQQSPSTITVNAKDDPAFYYSRSTYCGNAPDTVPAYIAKPGGNFVVTPATGLNLLNATTGAIRPVGSTDGVYVIKYTTNGICPSSQTFNLTISTSPKANFTFDFPSYCQYTGSVKPTFNNSSAGTFSATPGGIVFVNVNSGEIDLNASTPGNYLVRNIIAKNGNCNPDTSAWVPIAIKAAPVLMPSTKNQSLCSPEQTNITLNGGTSYTWTVNSPAFITGASSGTVNSATVLIQQALTNSSWTPGLVDYIITPKTVATGCVGKTDTVHVTVNPQADVWATPSSISSVCSNTKTNITLNSHAASSFTWKVVSATGVSGASDGSGSSIQQTLTATTASPGTVIYKVTPTAYTCKGDSIDVTIHVNPNPVVVVTIPPTAKTICSGQTTNIQLTSSTPGTNFTWTVNQTNVSGAVNGSGNSINQLLTILGTTQGKAVYTITGDANSCSGAVTVDFILVNPIPTLQVTPLDQEICSGEQINISMISNLPGAQFVWVVTPRTITGASDGGPTATASIKQTLTNPSSLVDSVTYTIVATAGGCSSNMAPLIDSTKARILVNPKPVASAVTPEIICSGDTTHIKLISTVTGSTFTYKATTVSVSGSGDGAGNEIEQPLTVNTTTDSVIYMITPASSKGCVGNPFKATAIVHPRPILAFIPSSNQAICSGTNISVDIISNVPGTQITWTPQPSVVTGAMAGTGASPAHVGDKLFVPGDTAATIIYNVTAMSGNGCASLPTNNPLKITVHPSPKVIFLGENLKICDGTSPQIVLASNVSGSTFSWTVKQTDVTGGFTDSNKVVIDQLLNLTSNKKGTALYTVTAHSLAMCASATPIDILVYVNPLDDPTFSYTSAMYCQEALDPSPTITGTTGIFSVAPTGLTFLDNKTGAIDLSESLPGDYKIAYSTNGVCPQQSFTDIKIRETPKADISTIKTDSSHCGTKTGAIKGITMIAGANPFTYEWKDATGTIVGTKLQLDSVAPGYYTLKITDGNGCTATIGNGNTLTIENINTVKANFSSDVTEGDNPLTVQLTNHSKGPIASYLWNFDNGTTSTLVHPIVRLDDVKSYNICLMVDDGKNECRDTLCKTIEVFQTYEMRIIPNVFTPNGDGVNDILKITATGLAAVHAEIYNRWGQKEYEWNTIDGGWDGHSATGLPAPEGTYYMILIATGADKNKTTTEIRQSFTLLR
jgi:gliding motility-associated-like protein